MNLKNIWNYAIRMNKHDLGTVTIMGMGTGSLAAASCYFLYLGMTVNPTAAGVSVGCAALAALLLSNAYAVLTEDWEDEPNSLSPQEQNSPSQELDTNPYASPRSFRR